MKYRKRLSWDRHRPEFFKLSLIFALAIAFMAFNYTYEAKPIIPFDGPSIEEDWIITPPITQQEKKVPTLPPPPKPKLLISPIIEPETEPKMVFEPKIEAPKSENYLVDEYANEPEPVLAPMVVPAEPEEVVDIPVPMAERMPVYIGCDLDAEERERRDCTAKSLLKHLYDNVKYPVMAREVTLEGTVVVSFVVDKRGEIGQIEVVRDIGMGCGEAVKKAFSTLDKFYPGKQNGRPVSVIYRVPVKFKLE